MNELTAFVLLIEHCTNRDKVIVTSKQKVMRHFVIIMGKKRKRHIIMTCHAFLKTVKNNTHPEHATAALPLQLSANAGLDVCPLVAPSHRILLLCFHSSFKGFSLAS